MAKTGAEISAGDNTEWQDLDQRKCLLITPFTVLDGKSLNR